MRTVPQVVAIQMCSGVDPEVNFAYLSKQLELLEISSPTLVCLPESWLAFSHTSSDTLALSQSNWQWIEKLKLLCQHHGIWLAAGTIALPYKDGQYYAASILLNDKGNIVAQYNKIHLFDVDVDDGSTGYRESTHTVAGRDVVVVDSPFGKIGLSVCYDVRFAGLYHTMVEQGAQLLLVPSAFTVVTGVAHWQPLLQARAIETQCYVIAAAQTGVHENGRKTFGHSLILSPWGTVLADAGKAPKVIQSDIDLVELMQIRTKMPVLAHNRFKSEFYE
ncbi:carbon-nitrogen hydrolase family protein [Pseudoalteromonas sp. MMG013]|uniref:carbon-nitrogen hydrolase family protein n=1 Tax=Pseudoalteromonas sp. MMG013 TaxID=2822687 RepID=UPI001B37517A|nr:carbon-nitrogen hydrolase family protein [Pseudoalteromonas sp. MMG013]MBQ4861408.1 carbon-nitrogen hydrolase family protein [Pseudoalteromonas sp. MMG013]